MIAALLLVVVGFASVSAVSAPQSEPLRVVPDVDYGRYAGKWYEIARLPNRFQKDCAGDVTATYAVRPDGRIDVTNRCVEAGGKVREASGIARRASGQPPSILEVRFAPAFLSFLPMVWGDYRILELAPDYSYALIGSSDRKYLWVLARTPTLDPSVYNQLLDQAKAQRFDVSRIMVTHHGGVTGNRFIPPRDDAVPG